MTFLFRVALLWLGLGLILGIVLRQIVSIARLWLVYAFGLLPWLGHLVYMTVLTQRYSSTPTGPTLLFALSSVILAAIVAVLGWRWGRTRPLRLALVPGAVLLVYALPFGLYSRVLNANGAGLGTLPVIVLGGATLFVSAVIGAFTLGRGVRGFSLLRRR